MELLGYIVMMLTNYSFINNMLVYIWNGKMWGVLLHKHVKFMAVDRVIVVCIDLASV